MGTEVPRGSRSVSDVLVPQPSLGQANTSSWLSCSCVRLDSHTSTKHFGNNCSVVLPAWEGAGDSYGGTAVNTTAVCVPLVVRHGKPPPTVCSGAKKLPIVNRANMGALASSWPPVCLLLSFCLPWKASPEPLGRHLFIPCPPLSSPTLSRLPLLKAVDKVRKSGQIIYFNPSLSFPRPCTICSGAGREREE